MEAYVASVDSTPSLSRVRVTRNISISRNPNGGEDDPQMFTPRLADFRRISSHPEAQSTSDDDSGMGDYNGPSTRLLSASLPPQDSSVQSTDTTHRLKALLDRFDANSRTPMTSTRVTMPPTPSEPDSDYESQPAQDARASIQSLFADALREPGDTPQKQKLSRRASYNEMGSPKVDQSTRKGNSDEEKELFLRRHGDHSFSAAASLDDLRLQLTESLSGKETSSHGLSEAPSTTRKAPSYFSRQIKSPSHHLPVNHTKSHKDLEPFKLIEDSDNNSHYPKSKLKSSMLLLDNSTTTGTDGARSTLRKSPGANATVREHLKISQHQTGDERASRSSSPIRSRRTSESLYPSPHIKTGRTSPGAWPPPPPPGSSPSSMKPRKHNSSANGHSGDGTSSPGTSVLSETDYKDRLNDVNRENQHTLERNWNRPQQHHSHSTSHVHAHRQDSPFYGSGSGSSSGGHFHKDPNSRPKLYTQHARSVSPLLSTSAPAPQHHSIDGHSLNRDQYGQRVASALSVDSEAGDGGIDRDHHASSSVSTVNVQLHPGARRHANVRSMSPTSSNFGEREEEIEELHERERNWNAPRPKWTHQHSHDHPHTPSSLSRRTLKGKEPEHSLDNFDTLNGGRHDRSVSPSGSRPGSKSPTLQIESSNHQITRSHSPRPPAASSSKVTDKHSPSSPPLGSWPILRSSRIGGNAGSSLFELHVKDGENEAVRSATYPGDSIRRHRRTTTEFSEPTSPFSHKDAVLPSALLPNDSNGSLFANESVPPPQMSTPTFKATHLPDLTISPVPSDVPLPLSPSSSYSPPMPLSPNRDRRSRASVDMARLQRAVTSNFTFPSRHSSPSPPSASDPPLLSTPPRVSPLPVLSASRFNGTSPPVELPELPDRPSSEDEKEVKYAPIRPISGNTLSTLRTPRFPGAFGTPYTASSSSPVPLVSQDDGITVSNEPQIGISPSHSGFTTSATPAPPGAYRPTPVIKLKGIRKVRFNNDAQIKEEMFDGGFEPLNGVISGVKASNPPPSPSSDEVPINISPTRNKALRLVDEYGRARLFTEDGQEIKLHRKGEATLTSETPVIDEVTMTPRRRAKMRQVDEFGNELVSKTASSNTNQSEELSSDVPEIKRKNAVLVHLARSLGNIKNDLAEEEDALATLLPNEGQQDHGRLNDLVTVSDTARIERVKLMRKLEHERLSVNGKTFIARSPPRDSVTEYATRGTWWQRKWRLIIIVLILELLLLLMGYRLANLHAKHLWLKTHFDPFFPALYLHPLRPGFLNRFKPVPMEWSAFAISGAAPTGSGGSIVSVGIRFWEEVMGWRLEPW